jgi:hypothetical protein
MGDDCSDRDLIDRLGSIRQRIGPGCAGSPTAQRRGEADQL